MFFCIAENECTCDNGTPKTGAACTEHDAPMCASCEAGFRPNDDDDATECLKVCTCDNGTAVSGAACTEHGASICASCDAGFRINDDATECLGTGLVACERALYL